MKLGIFTFVQLTRIPKLLLLLPNYLQPLYKECSLSLSEIVAYTKSQANIDCPDF